MRSWDKIELSAIALVTVLAPLPLGSADPWPVSIIETVIFLVVIAEAGFVYGKNSAVIDPALPAARSSSTLVRRRGDFPANAASAHSAKDFIASYVSSLQR